MKNKLLLIIIVIISVIALVLFVGSWFAFEWVATKVEQAGGSARLGEYSEGNYYLDYNGEQIITDEETWRDLRNVELIIFYLFGVGGALSMIFLLVTYGVILPFYFRRKNKK